MKNLILVTTIFLMGLTACKSSKDTSNVNEDNAVEKRSEKPQKGDKKDIGEMFSKMDENGDGMISKSELKGPIANDFDKIDTNNDGFISMEELKAAPKPERRGKKQRRN